MRNSPPGPMSCATCSDLVTFNVPLGIKSRSMFWRLMKHIRLSNVVKLLVGGFKHDFIFHFIYGMSSFPLTNSYFSEGLKPPTRLYCHALPVFVSLGLFVWVDHIYGTSVYYRPLSNENITDCWWWSRVVAQPSNR